MPPNARSTSACVGQRWLGDPAREIEPWRDTGIEIRGPAVADVEHAFAQTWALTGAPIQDELPKRASLPVAGDVPLRVIATIPATASLYRLDQLMRQWRRGRFGSPTPISSASPATFRGCALR